MFFFSFCSFKKETSVTAAWSDTDLKNDLYQAAVNHLHLTPLHDSI